MDAPGASFDLVTGILSAFAVWAAVAHAALASLSEVRLRWLAEQSSGSWSARAEQVRANRASWLAAFGLARTLSLGLGVSMLAARHGLAWGGGLAALVASLEAGARAFWGRRGGRGALRWVVGAGWWARPFAIWTMLVVRLGASLGRRRAEPEQRRLARFALEHAIARSLEAGSLDGSEADLLRSVLEFEDTIVREVMVPRHRVVAFEASASLDEVLRRVVETGHSRYPVYRERLEELVGLLVAKDLFRYVREGRDLSGLSAGELIRCAPFVTEEDVPVGRLLRRMQRDRVHLAVVTDRFGTVRGIATLEDILEELVGEIQDEHDREETAVRRQEDGSILVHGDFSIYDLDERLGSTLASEAEEFDSIGGLLVARLGELPRPGDRVRVDGWELRVREAEGPRVRLVEVRALPSEAAAATASATSEPRSP